VSASREQIVGRVGPREVSELSFAGESEDRLSLPRRQLDDSHIPMNVTRSLEVLSSCSFITPQRRCRSRLFVKSLGLPIKSLCLLHRSHGYFKRTSISFPSLITVLLRSHTTTSTQPQTTSTTRRIHITHAIPRRSAKSRPRSISRSPNTSTSRLGFNFPSLQTLPNRGGEDPLQGDPLGHQRLAQSTTITSDTHQAPEAGSQHHGIRLQQSLKRNSC
jgi:hypothetical protein